MHCRVQYNHNYILYQKICNVAVHKIMDLFNFQSVLQVFDTVTLVTFDFFLPTDCFYRLAVACITLQKFFFYFSCFAFKTSFGSKLIFRSTSKE